MCTFGGCWHERSAQQARGQQCCGAARPGAMRVTPQLVMPILDQAVRIDDGSGMSHHRRTVRLIKVFLLAHPLDPYRHARQCVREQRRIGGGIIGAVVAIAARTFDVDTANGFFEACGAFPRSRPDPETRLECGSIPSRLLGQTVPAHKRDRWTMTLIGAREFCLERARTGASNGRSLVDHHGILGLEPHQIRCQLFLCRKQRLLLPTREASPGGAWPALPEILPARRRQGSRHRVSPRARPACATPQPCQHQKLRAATRRAHDSRVDHSRQAHVLNIRRAARHLGRNVDARQRLTHLSEPVGWRQQWKWAALRRAGCCPRPAAHTSWTGHRRP